MPNFVYTPPKNKGDPIIKPINMGDYKGNISYVLVYTEGDAILYKNKKGNGTRFDIAPTPLSESLRHGLPSNDRLRGLDDRNLRKLSAITGISLDTEKCHMNPTCFNL